MVQGNEREAFVQGCPWDRRESIVNERADATMRLWRTLGKGDFILISLTSLPYVQKRQLNRR